MEGMHFCDQQQIKIKYIVAAAAAVAASHALVLISVFCILLYIALVHAILLYSQHDR